MEAPVGVKDVLLWGSALLIAAVILASLWQRDSRGVSRALEAIGNGQWPAHSYRNR